MALTIYKIEYYLNRIFAGISYEYVDDILLTFKFPSNKIKLKAELIYDRSFSEAKKQGMLPVEELEALIEKRNPISENDKLKLKKLSSQLEAQKILLSKTTRVKANQDRIKSVISRINNDIREIELKKLSKLIMSAETKADEDKSFYICSRCVYKDDGSLLWPTYESALKENRLAFKDNILLAFLKFYSGLPVNIIREIARSSLWRIRYIHSLKTSDPLFGVPAVDYTSDQLNLVYWSNYYQNIYDMMPESRPSDATIDDDDALDAYMKTFYEERNREEAERRHNGNRSGKLSAFDAEEVIITRSHELYEDIEYDTPREAQKIKDRIDIKKKAKRG
jgi:hypothetical protein